MVDISVGRCHALLSLSSSREWCPACDQLAIDGEGFNDVVTRATNTAARPSAALVPSTPGLARRASKPGRSAGGICLPLLLFALALDLVVAAAGRAPKAAPADARDDAELTPGRSRTYVRELEESTNPICFNLPSVANPE